MSCCGGSTESLPPVVVYGFTEGTPCNSITADLLNLWKGKIDCYLRHGLWGKINSNEEELTIAQSYLAEMIDRKIADPNDCEGLDTIHLVRAIIDKIVKVGVCL